MAKRVEIASLAVGDQFVSWQGPVIELMREAETYDKRFGIEWMRLWCKRLDTGEEGWVFYASGAIVTKH